MSFLIAKLCVYWLFLFTALLSKGSPVDTLTIAVVRALHSNSETTRRYPKASSVGKRINPLMRCTQKSISLIPAPTRRTRNSIRNTTPTKVHKAKRKYVCCTSEVSKKAYSTKQLERILNGTAVHTLYLASRYIISLRYTL